MKKGEIYEGIVSRVDFPNKGKIECDEGEVVVKNVIPGQRIRFMITKKRSGKCEGRLLEVIDKSTIELMKNMKNDLPAISPERVFSEFRKALMTQMKQKTKDKQSKQSSEARASLLSFLKEVDK